MIVGMGTLLDDIEAFLKAQRMAPTALGAALGDRHLVRQIREGRRLWPETEAKVRSFMRLYVNPGMNHGGSASRQDGSKAPDKVDMFGELDQWVTSGKPPGPLTVTAYNAKGDAESSKPMCEFPLYPRYIKGDANSATSYKCMPQ